MSNISHNVIVYVSILNWNGAYSTLECVKTVMATNYRGVEIRYVVLDNGSSTEDRQLLRNGCLEFDVSLLELATNVGFSAGHNFVIKQAMDEGADFIWLLNNDCLVTQDTFAALYETMVNSPECGIVSPVIVARHDHSIMDFCGAIHDWQRLSNSFARTPMDGGIQEQRFPEDCFVSGAAPLLRIKALREVGLLDEGFFAYFEENDLCVRLHKMGWSTRVAYQTQVFHTRHKSYLRDRPPYHFYLMARNGIHFFLRHTPINYRKMIRLRLVSRAMILAQNLWEQNLDDKANACLRGVLDGLLGIEGPPRLEVQPPWWFSLTARHFPYRLQQWLG